MAEGQTLADPKGSRDVGRGGWLAIDAAFSRSHTGIGTYSQHLIHGLRAGALGERLLPLTPPPGASRTLWMMGEVGPELRRRKAALFHGVANFDLPLTKPASTRFVLTVHDLIPLAWPDAVSRGYRLQFQVWLSRCLRLADIVICPTSAVATDLRAAFAVVPATRVVPLGVTPAARCWRARSKPRYFLAVGSVEVRKNLTGLLRAFEARRSRWRELGIELWIAGQGGFGGARIIEELRGRKGVNYLGPQTPQALAGLMRGSLALCAPSLAEGFGLPPLEAMAAGIPVLASNIPAHREVLGDAAVLLSPDDTEAWASAMLRLAEDRALGPRLAALGRTRAAGFTWERTARETEAVYREVL